MIGIILLGYNRIDSFKRAFNSLCAAYYPTNERVDLILSIDNSGSNDVENFSKEITWTHGEKIIRTFSVRQGLRKHVLSCSEYFSTYEALIILEDDICVAEDFFNYAMQAVSFYKNDNRVAGISLYSHSVYQENLMRFSPEVSIYDNYFIKYAASWGQIWMKNQFMDFFNWYEKFGDAELIKSDIPSMVKGWPETSWLKYHIAYCSVKNKYFVYPYHSLSTNYADPGQHFADSSNVYQVELQKGICKKYSFAEIDNEYAVKYDAFFENEGLYDVFPDCAKLILDVNGLRKYIPDDARFCLTTKKIDYKVVCSFGLVLRPIEENVFSKINGNEIYLYDLSSAEKNTNNTNPENSLWAYNCKGKSLPPKLFSYLFMKIKERFR